MGTPASLACPSISVTPQEETPARNASLFVNASAWGRDDESRTSWWPRAWLTARPSTPLLDDRTASIFMSLTLIPPLRQFVATPRYITPQAPRRRAPFFLEAPACSSPTMDFDADCSPPELAPAGRFGCIRGHDGRAAPDLRLDASQARVALAPAIPDRARPGARHRATRLLH